jgi:hypothetical protein
LNDTKKYVVNLTGDVDIETWLYVKHNGTHIHFGMLVWFFYTHVTDEFAIAFDEGNDTGSGSGTRDYVLTPLQEDSKVCYSSGTLRDGYYNVSQWYSKDVEIDFDAECHHENDHSASLDEIEYWEGMGFVDDHWECEFAIPFVGNDAGTSDVSDLSCNVTDIIGMKIQYFHTGPENYYYPAGTLYEVLTYANLGFIPPTFESCMATGEQKDTFNLYEDVYMNGTGFLNSETYDLYIVEDVATWTDGLPIPTRVPGTLTSIASDINGTIMPTTVWSDPSIEGAYDIVIDVNGNAQYDVGIDALDNNDVEVTAGFVTPEFPSTIALLTAFGLATASAIVIRKKHII